jgi:hypothetical protein
MLKNQNQTAAMPCPECKSPLPMSIEILLSGQPIKCLNPACGIELKVDYGQSSQAMKELEKLNQSLTDLQKAKNPKL